MFESMSFSPGKIVYNDFNINPEVSLVNQIEFLKEDLFQVNYFDKFLIDIGWHPEFDIRGTFKICIIKDFDWQIPLFEKRCRDIITLNQNMEECINLVNNLIEVK